jgi:hypothetical protein
MMTTTATAARPINPTTLNDEQLLALPENARLIPSYARLIDAAQKRRDALKLRLERDLKNRDSLERAARANGNQKAAEVHRKSAFEVRELLATL